MDMHWCQNGSNNPVAGSTVPGAGECAWTRPLGSKVWVYLIKIVLYIHLYSRMEPLEAD
jgi:hypothetical protein